ncbi:MAG: DEAD/DEAH box helicase [Verrucomicrobia bacterium]|nr:DEAD/DEAH box helicase [Verrucomicrobiota bacterium]
MNSKLFSELGLSPEILRAIDRLGFEQASPIQAEAIPILMAGHDAVGQSQTGSGKTAAFAIPAIEKTDPQLKAVQALVLCPTRELAVQVAEEVHQLAFFKRGIQALPIYGGQSYERQFAGLKRGAQLVIGTPGRVLDHLARGTLRLDHVKMMILDEADVMLDMGFREDIEKVLQALPRERQTVFFSATMPAPIRDWIERYAREPKSVKIEQKTLTVPTVEQVYYEVDRRFKVELLARLIDIHDLRLGIIFCNTKRMVDELADHLEAQGYSADRLHGDMSQGMRDRVMGKFRQGGLEFLVATDVAARGIDVDDVQVVFNYDLPYDPEDYVHRIGRTGRAGRSGRAISFVAGREIFQVRNIERFTRTRLHRAHIPSLDEVEAARDQALAGKVRTVLLSGEFKRQDRLIETLMEEGHESTDIASALIHLLAGGEDDPSPEANPRRSPSTDHLRDKSESNARPRRPRELQAAPPIQVKRSFPNPAAAAELPSAAPKEVARREVPPQTAHHPVVKIPPPPPITRSLPTPTEEKSSRPAPAASHPERSTSAIPRSSAGKGFQSSARSPMMPDWVRKKMGLREVPPKPRRPDHRPPSSSIPSRPQKPLEKFTASKPPPPPLSKGAPGSNTPPLRSTRRTPSNQSRLWINVGEEMGVETRDVVGAILGETGLPANSVGTVDVRSRHLFVDVATEHVGTILNALKRTKIRQLPIKAKLA